MVETSEMKNSKQNLKKSSDKKNQKYRPYKNNRGRSFKKSSGPLKSKNKPDLKNGNDKDSKPAVKPAKTYDRRESRLEYKKRLNKLYSSLLMNHKNSLKSIESINILLKELPSNYSLESNKGHISRILQACLKYGTPRERSLIFEKVRENFNILNLNAHSSKFFIKLFNYCNFEAKLFLRNAFFNEKKKNLLFNRFSSEVMDVIYMKLRTKEQIAVLRLYCLANLFFLNKEDSKRSKEIKSIYQLIDLILNSESKSACIEKMCSVLTKLVESELLVTSLSHDILFVYLHTLDDNQQMSVNNEVNGTQDHVKHLSNDEHELPNVKEGDEQSSDKKVPINSKSELVYRIYKIFGQLLSTKSGNRCMIMLMDYSNNKIKKHIVKCLKRDFPEAVYNQVNVSLLIKTVNATDDTKLTGECLINPLLKDLKKAVYNKQSCKFLMNILDNANERAPNCLKEPELRTQELQSRLVPALLEFFQNEDLKEAMKNKHSGPILLHLLKLTRDETLVDSILHLLKENLDDVLNNTNTLRFIQSLVKTSNRVSGGLVDLRVSENIWGIVKSNIDSILRSNSVFLLVDLLESFEKYGEDRLMGEFRSEITSERISEAQKAFEGENSTGLNILSSLLSK